MSDKTNTANKPRNDYDDGNIPDVDLPAGEDNVTPRSQTSSPKKDSSGGDD